MTSVTDEKTTTIEPAVYVACLASYNAGKLHGQWIKLSDYSGADELHAGIVERVIKTSPVADAEEYAVHDFEGFPEGYDPGECPNYAELYRVAELVEEHGDAFAAALWLADDVSEAVEMVSERYAGHYGETMRDPYTGKVLMTFDRIDWDVFGHELMESSGYLEKVPEAIRCYIDCAGYAEDLALSGDIKEHNAHVFWTR